MSGRERRRQLLGIGLRMLVERPIQELSVDAVAAEAGISRGLLFHYFPTKADYHDAVIGAATRRMFRNTAPDDGAAADAAVAQFVTRFYEQIERRRDFYLALVYGAGALSLGGDRVENMRERFAARLVAALGLDSHRLTTVRAWAAYVEDRALHWSDPTLPRRPPLSTEVDHACAALDTLLALPEPAPAEGW
ncbi:MAG TPA: TetR/AcrR family transcriptional regulator [Marmoricola sp.]|nr:TetR/AcrR family transcriptional regulator [Marmoricola sp.]